jgi:hypothetical protein
MDKVTVPDEEGAILQPTRHTPLRRDVTRRFLMDMRHVKFHVRALRSCGVRQGRREAVQVAMMRWGEGRVCEAKRGQPALRPSPQTRKPPVRKANPIHVLNFTKFGFAVRASRAGHVPHSRT